MAQTTVHKVKVTIPIDQITLKGELTIPEGAKSIIIFSLGNRILNPDSDSLFLAEKIRAKGFATLVFGLVTEADQNNPHNRFDTELLIQRLLLVTNWVKENLSTRDLEIGYFGSGTGTAYALAAASMLGQLIKAVVSRGGHPELALPYLPEVKAPVLMIVGGMDYYVMESNETAFSLLNTEKQILVVEDATHTFDEPGKLDQVAENAGAWFDKFMKVK